MKRTALLALVFVSVFALAVALLARPTLAQDEMLHTCDSTLITLLFVAEYEYGFESMTMDLATFDKGQYAPLFDAMMMMDEEMMEEEMMESTEEAMMEEPMMDEMMTLSIGNIEGEDSACTELRAELDAFFYTKFNEMMMMEEDGM